MFHNWLKIFEIPQRILEKTGIWVDPTRPRTILERFKMFTFITMFSLSITSNILYLINAKDFDDFFEAFGFFVTLIGALMRLLNFINKTEKINNCLVGIKDLIEMDHWIEDRKDSKLKKRLSTATIVLRVKVGLVVVFFLSCILKTLVDHELPMKFWFPTDPLRNKIWFCLAAALNFGLAFVLSPVTAVLNTFPLILICFLLGITEELTERLENVEEIEKLKKTSKVVINNEKIMELKNDEDESLKRLLKCIAIHIKIKNLTADVSNLFGEVIWTEGMFSVIILCMVSFTMTNVNSVGFGQMLSLFTPIILNTFLPCLFGSELAFTSEKLSASLFHLNWMQQSKHFKIAMKIFMENSKKPIYLSAFGTIHLTLENFLVIMNSAYSYYAVLKNLKL